MAQTALVTGGAGFIGSHVVDRLVGDGFRVVVVDSLVTGRREAVHGEADFRELDVRSPRLAELFKAERPDVVFHLAAAASVSGSVRNPAKDARTNVMGSINVLEAARRVGIERFVFSSTGGALYGEPAYLPCDEAHPVRPLSPYGAAKSAVEGYVHTIAALGGFEATVLRYANVYGPRQDPHGEAGVVAIFARRMLDGRDVVIYGDGEQERDFVYVSDVVEANVKALAGPAGGVFNIGRGEGTSVNAVFGALAAATGYARPPKHRPARAGDVSRIYLDVRKAREDLGWSAAVGLEAGLVATVESLRATG
ncbi:MAG: NAD-dependent epimerase/dehydratase family protein [Chloroflexi bacterium]|nr:NAD-dependent epimerase/dehydratase family protein [Chloroflexota bacterium]